MNNTDPINTHPNERSHTPEMISPDYTDFTVAQLLSPQERAILSPAARLSEEPFEFLEHVSDLFDSAAMDEAGEVVQGRLLLLYYWVTHDLALADWLLHALRGGGDAGN